MWDIDGNEYIDYVGSCLLGDLRLLVMQMMRFCSFSLSSIESYHLILHLTLS
jgi:hypothetical protein